MQVVLKNLRKPWVCIDSPRFDSHLSQLVYLSNPRVYVVPFIITLLLTGCGLLTSVTVSKLWRNSGEYGCSFSPNLSRHCKYCSTYFVHSELIGHIRLLFFLVDVNTVYVIFVESFVYLLVLGLVMHRVLHLPRPSPRLYICLWSVAISINRFISCCGMAYFNDVAGILLRTFSVYSSEVLYHSFQKSGQL